MLREQPMATADTSKAELAERSVRAPAAQRAAAPQQATAPTREDLHRRVERLPESLIAQAAEALDVLESQVGDTRERALIERWIRPHPYQAGPGDVVLAESSVPVYAIIGQLPVYKGNLDQVADDYEVPREAVEAALAYHRRHRAVIDARIFTGE
jgi:uncharacterized protein (DUF433 family)